MRGTRRRAASGRVKQVRGRIEQWRKTRAKRSPMPEPLWDAAVQLAQADGVYPIARALQVSYQSLKYRVALASKESCRAPAGFVELTPIPASPAPASGSAPGGETVLELSNRGGATLTIRFPAERELDVERLAAAFLHRGL
ncbi:MAG: hypothetical protein JRS35_25030 [Deltaproteobacteria bacterium]|nr:hypothetical protein [Deltaproteobacteria bacterium]